MRLYRFRFSTNVERVTLALAYKGIDVESVWVDPDDRSVLERELSSNPPDAQRVADHAAAMQTNLDRHEALLAGRDYLFGESFSAADCAAFPFLKYALGRDADDDELFHRILADYQSVKGRPRLEAWIRRVDAR